MYDTVNNFLCWLEGVKGVQILKQNRNIKALNRVSDYGVIQMNALSV